MLLSGWGLEKWRSSPPSGPCGLGMTLLLYFFYIWWPRSTFCKEPTHKTTKVFYVSINTNSSNSIAKASDKQQKMLKDNEEMKYRVEPKDCPHKYHMISHFPHKVTTTMQPTANGVEFPPKLRRQRTQCSSDDAIRSVVLNLFHCWDPLNATDVVWDPQVKIEKVCAPQ